MHPRTGISWTAVTSLLGAALWATIAILAGGHHAPLSIIELLFLLAPLVIVPLGLELSWAVTEPPSSLIHLSLRALQPIAAAAAVVSLWLPPGPVAALLAGVWLLLCTMLALARAADLRSAGTQLSSFVVCLAYVDLVIGGGWFLVSRAELHPMGFQEPIILLTAVHFHYSGFATAVIGATALRQFDRRGPETASLRSIVRLSVLLPFALAAGITFSRVLRLIAAIALSLSVAAFAGVQCWCARKLKNRTARVYLGVALVAALAAFSLAGVYAVRDYLGRDWLTMPRMATSHGVLNGLGFVLSSILAWLIALHAEIGEMEDDRSERKPSRRSAPQPFPEFVARDFYDR
jgi:hypothetical protein